MLNAVNVWQHWYIQSCATLGPLLPTPTPTYYVGEVIHDLNAEKSKHNYLYLRAYFVLNHLQEQIFHTHKLKLITIVRLTVRVTVSAPDVNVIKLFWRKSTLSGFSPKLKQHE